MSARTIAVLVAVLAMLPQAFAQQDQERLTDNEVRAAYCLGYFKAGQQEMQKLCQNPTPPLAQACATGEQQGNAETQRVLGYLVAKGIIFAPGPNGLDAMVAVSQGRADFQACLNWAGTPEATACADKCRQPAGDLAKCMGACEPALCRKAAACSNLSFLPY